jgi:polyisoprenoid-binding protein YceI
VSADTLELPPSAPGEDWLPPPGTYSLDLSRCITEFAVRVCGMKVGGRFAPRGGRLVVRDDPHSSELHIAVSARPRRLGGPLLGRLVLGRRSLGVPDDDEVRFEAAKLRQYGNGRFRMPGELEVRDQKLAVTFDVRVVLRADDRLIALGTAALPLRATCWGQTRGLRRAILGRRVRVLVAAEFRR